MLNSVRKLKLRFRIEIYTLAMVLLALVFVFLWPWPGKSPFLVAWLVCFGSGLASMVIVEPFRRPSGSPYGFLLGGAARTAPPLLLVLLVVATKQPVDRLFWICLIISYFVMLTLVLLLTIPHQSRPTEPH